MFVLGEYSAMFDCKKNNPPYKECWEVESTNQEQQWGKTMGKCWENR
jgi:hypothetical protein